MAETILDLKSFSGLNYGPHLSVNECQACLNLDDANTPALRTARTFESVELTGEGTFQGAWIEEGEVLATVWDNVLYYQDKTYPLSECSKPRRFLRISLTQVLILPDVYVLFPRRDLCRPYDNAFTTIGKIVENDSNSMRLRLNQMPKEIYKGYIYVEGFGRTYYDEETDPTATLLYFEVSSTEKINGYTYLNLSAHFRTETGTLATLPSNEFTLTLRKVMPKITDATICRNRLWAVAGKKLVASKLGSPMTFDDFSGLSTDSFELPMEETLTAVSHFGERVVFMSKTSLYELYGDRPSNYQVSAAKPGGCAYPFSICNAGGYLVYADRDCIYRYGGGDPQPVTDSMEFPAWSDVFGVSDGETCLLGIDDHLFRYRPARNTLFELPLAPKGGFTAEGERYFYDETTLWRAIRTRSQDAYHYRSGWCNLDRLGDVSPRELYIRMDGIPPHVALITRDGQSHPLTAMDHRGDGLLRLPFPADLQNRVFAIDLSGSGDVCIHRITIRG